MIRNGIVEVTIENPSGLLTGIRYNGMDNVFDWRHCHDDRGYWDIFTGHCPMDKFLVRRGILGLYMYGIFKREEDFLDASMDHIRIVFKPKEDSRQRIMPSSYDRSSIHSQTLAFKEAVVLTNPYDPQLKGEADEKYQYSIENKDNKLNGWISDDDVVGFWIITPSSEFRAGGLHKQGLASHSGATSLCSSQFISQSRSGSRWNVTH
ncbi:hypothetical protein F3Y22_tig00111650pilonHSYRG00253 [Hibiscus syriacus]|uniref:Uncharacterized protein n=1 Tax=Hibiscus syriacus TaxID=106335 RepID=A0A6A2XJC9_HIBSY|nr:hypothetical protein F3Y22_tig00111650pilonHSYRG00253 [Hibiscus syriacus]